MANCVMCNKSVTGYYGYEGAKIPVCFEHYKDGTFADYLAAKQGGQSNFLPVPHAQSCACDKYKHKAVYEFKPASRSH